MGIGPRLLYTVLNSKPVANSELTFRSAIYGTGELNAHPL